MLYRTLHNGDGHQKLLLVVPSAMKSEVLKAAHNDFGHKGPEKTEQVVLVARDAPSVSDAW